MSAKRSSAGRANSGRSKPASRGTSAGTSGSAKRAGSPGAPRGSPGKRSPSKRTAKVSGGKRGGPAKRGSVSRVERQAKASGRVERPKRRTIAEALRLVYGPDAADVRDAMARARPDDAVRAAFKRVADRGARGTRRRYTVARPGTLPAKDGSAPGVAPVYRDRKRGKLVSFANVRRSKALRTYWEAVRESAFARGETVSQAVARIRRSKRPGENWRDVLARDTPLIRRAMERVRQAERRRTRSAQSAPTIRKVRGAKRVTKPKAKSPKKPKAKGRKNAPKRRPKR